MSHLLLFSNLPFTTSTSSSSFTLPSTTTQEHAVQSGQHDLLQKHPVHHEHLQALPVDKQRHQESLCRENLQSGGNPRKTTPTGYEPKELATVSGFEDYPGDPEQENDAQKEFGEHYHRKSEGIWRNWDTRLTGFYNIRHVHFQSQMHFDDSVESIADSDLEDGELQKMLTSPLYAEKVSGKPDATVVQEREVSAQITQANRKESLRSHSSEGQKASEKPDALFSSEQGNLIRSSVFRNANPSNLRGSLLEGNKDHLLNQARSDLAKQELHVESLDSASVNYSIGVTGCTIQICWVKTRTSSTTRRIVYEGEKKLRITQIRNMHEMGEIERAQERRIDEVSVQKLRENHETIQQLTSQLQQMQEQMNSINDSWDFQDVESNYCGRLCHVSSQTAMIPSSRALLSRDKRLPLDSWNQSGLQENVFGNQFSAFDSPRDYSQRIKSDDVKPPLKQQGRRLVTQVKTDKIKAQCQCRHLRQGRCLRVLQYRWNYRRTTWSDSKDSKYRNCNSTNSVIHNVWCGRFDPKHKSLPVLIFHRKQCYGSKKCRWLILWTS